MLNFKKYIDNYIKTKVKEYMELYNNETIMKIKINRNKISKKTLEIIEKFKKNDKEKDVNKYYLIDTVCKIYENAPDEFIYGKNAINEYLKKDKELKLEFKELNNFEGILASLCCDDYYNFWKSEFNEIIRECEMEYSEYMKINKRLVS